MGFWINGKVMHSSQVAEINLHLHMWLTGSQMIGGVLYTVYKSICKILCNLLA